MGLALGNREKIVIGSIAMIFIIAGLHFFIFSAKAREYAEARNQFRNAEDAYNKLKNISPVRLETYIAETQKYQDTLNQIIRELNLDVPVVYLNPTAPENAAQIRDIRREHVQNLMEMHKESTTFMNFLGDEGWAFPRELPEDIVKKRVNLWDIVSKIEEAQLIIDASKGTPTVVSQQEVKYRNFMSQIGIDLAKVEALKTYGKIVPSLKLMAHAELILKEKPEDYKITIDKLYRLLRVDIDVTNAYFVNRQLLSLRKLIEIAKANDIDQIKSVTLHEMQNLTEQTEVKPEEGQPARIAPGMIPGAGEFRGEMIDPEMLMMMGGEYGGMMATVQPQIQEKVIASLTPIKIRYEAPNLNSSRFLFEITHGPGTYEIDDLAIRSVAESNVEVIATINVTAQVVGVIVTLAQGE